MNTRNSAKVLSAVVLLAVVALASACSSSSKTATVAASQGSSSSSSSSSIAPTSSTGTSSSVAANDALAGLQPLFPFATQADADAWVAASRSGGQQPWHLDPDATALSFTNGYLGFTELDTVVSSTVDGAQAHVGVGFVNPNGDKSTAAVIHLVRFGSASDAPWEVVGTDDSASFMLDNPKYAALVGASFEAGGHITGVDENIVVQVHQSSSESAVGGAPAVPAGGENSPWHATVTLNGATDPVLAVVAFTGGHLLKVERFAVTAVRLPA